MTPDVILLTVMVISGVTAFVAIPAAFPKGVIKVTGYKPYPKSNVNETQAESRRAKKSTQPAVENGRISFKEVQMLCNYYGSMYSVKPEALLWELCLQYSETKLKGLSVTAMHLAVSELARSVVNKESVSVSKFVSRDGVTQDQRKYVLLKELCDLCIYYANVHLVGAETVLWAFCAEYNQMGISLTERDCNAVIPALALRLAQGVVVESR